MVRVDSRVSRNTVPTLCSMASRRDPLETMRPTQRPVFSPPEIDGNDFLEEFDNMVKIIHRACAACKLQCLVPPWMAETGGPQGPLRCQ